MALAAIFGVVAEANRYFAGAGALGAAEDRSGAHGDGAVDDGRDRSGASRILCQPFIPGSAAKLLDLLAVPADQRSFAACRDADSAGAGHGAAGAGAGVSALCRAGRRRRTPSMLVDSHCHLDFPDFAEERDGRRRARARRPASAAW